MMPGVRPQVKVEVMPTSRIARYAYPAVAWLPFAALLLMYVCHKALVGALGDGLILLGLLMALSSVALGCVGAFLTISAGSWRESRIILAVSTALAFLPALVYVWQIVTQL